MDRDQGGKKLIKISARSGKQFPRGHGEVECDDARLKFLKTKLLFEVVVSKLEFLVCVCVMHLMVQLCNSFIKNFFLKR